MSAPIRGNREAAARAIADLLRALGLDPAAEPELGATPERAADFYFEASSGLDPKAEPELVTFPHTGDQQLVAVRDLSFHSMCVHHLAPFFGRALIAYLPDRQLLGISGAARLLDFYARRPQLQERLGAQIADHLDRLVNPRGVAVILEARHLCMEMRGARRSAWVETRVVRGTLAEPEWAAVLQLGPRGG
ncbi:MAG: GTP cyclohydrolase I [Candidatus Eisenbacteria bacterium]